MSLKKIRNEIYGDVNRPVKPANQIIDKVMNDLESDSEEEPNIWEASSMSISDIKKVIKTMNEDPEQWKSDVIKKSNDNVSNYIDEITKKLHNEQVKMDDVELFG